MALIDAYLGSTVWRTPNPVVVNTQDFLTSGTWTPGLGYLFCLVETWGAGGAGYSANFSTPCFSNLAAAYTQCPGGGGGGYNRQFFLIANLPSTVAVTVGVGGTPSYAYSDSGRNGGLSSFGSYVISYGGNGAQSPYAGGAGGGPLSAPIGNASRDVIQEGPGPRITWPVTTGHGWSVTPQTRNVGFGGNVTGLALTAYISQSSQGDGGYHPAMVNGVIPVTPAAPGFYVGGGGAVPGTVGTTGNVWTYAPPVSGQNGAQSVYGGGGGGSGFTIPCGANTEFYYIIGRAPGSSGFIQGIYVAPGNYPQGSGGYSLHAGNGGNGGGQNQNGQNGSIPGGGGGGAGAPSSKSYSYGPLGGHGGGGRVRVTQW